MSTSQIEAVETAGSFQSKPPSDQYAAFLSGFLGWTLDAFDFFLVVVCLTAIAREFGRSDVSVALAISLTLAFRPLGAFIFGLMADRYGRRLPLMISLVFYSVAQVLSGLAPNFATFLAMRALFGIGMGGEWGVGASLAMEKAPPRLRGLLSALLQEGYAIGYLLSAICYYLFFEKWGWRPLFFLGGTPALLAIYVRSRVKESEVWQRTRHETWRQLGEAVISHWRLLLRLIVLMTAMGLVSHGTQDLYPAFLERHRKFSPDGRSMITMISMIGAIGGGLIFGWLSDRIGRRRALIMALVGAGCLIPLWAFAPTTALLVLGAFSMQMMVQGAWGIIPAHLTELSPDSVRGFLPGFAYQCGILLSSSVVYLEAVFAARISYAGAMALTAATVFTLAVIVVNFSRERRGIAFGVKG